MSQQPSLTQSAHSVRQVLTAYTINGGHRASRTIVRETTFLSALVKKIRLRYLRRVNLLKLPARGEAQTTPRAFCCDFHSVVVMRSPRRTSSQWHLTEALQR